MILIAVQQRSCPESPVEVVTGEVSCLVTGEELTTFQSHYLLQGLSFGLMKLRVKEHI